MAEYTEAFAQYILECKRSYEDILTRIENGDVPPNHSAKVVIKIAPEMVDAMRFDAIAASVQDG